jgi:SMODS-associated and fused to various effectors sensor domain
MVGPVGARMLGDEYQSICFWLQVCRMLKYPDSIDRVDIEAGDSKSFDDVVVYYAPGAFFDEFNRPLLSDRYQIKYHVDAQGSITWESLWTPNAIHAKSVSFLQRLRNIQVKHALNGSGSRFHLYSVWSIERTDLLAEMYRFDIKAIRRDKFMEGKTSRSAAGGLRERLLEHLEITDPEELWRVMEPLRVATGPALSEQREKLEWALMANNLKPWPFGSTQNVYQSLSNKMITDRQNSHNTKSIVELCKREDLLNTESESHLPRVGIRSFHRWAEYLDFADALLDLCKYFQDRYIVDCNLWSSTVLSQIEVFVHQTFLRGHTYELHLQAHLSIALAAGRLLPAKSGVNLLVNQGTVGDNLWRVDRNDYEGPKPAARVEYQEMRADQPDLAVVLSVTHNIREDVSDYLHRSGKQVRGLLHLCPAQGPSSLSVSGGSHAVILAEEFAAAIRQHRRLPGSPIGRVLLFAACPVTLIFLLGREIYNLAPLIMHEHDFENPDASQYYLSIIF